VTTATFLPRGFTPPAGLEHDQFRLRPITIHDVVKDYDAVMSSREHLWSLFGECWGWPPASLTLEEDLIDLAWHQKEADLRKSFNFAVLSPDERRLLGCVYVDPPTKQGYDAEVFWWARQDELASGLEEELGAAARGWVEREWPFERVAFPGRDQPWDEYDALPDA
jgi:hypothetical protein